MNFPGRRYSLDALFLLLLLTAPALASAQQCEQVLKQNRIHLIISQAPGGGYDQYARMLREILSEDFGARTSIQYSTTAQGRLARQQVSGSSEGAITVGLFNSEVFTHPLVNDPTVSLDNYHVLGFLTEEPKAWLATRPLDELLRKNDLFVAGTTDAQGTLFRLVLPSFLLGMDLRIVPGFSGQSELKISLLRKEIDVMASSLTSILRAADETARPVLLLSDAPDPAIPDVPYLAGKDGIVDHLAREPGIPGARERLQFARLATEVAKSRRVLMVSSQLDAPLADCLSQTFEAILRGNKLKALADQVNRPIQPLGPLEAAVKMRELQASGAALRDELQGWYSAALR